MGVCTLLLAAMDGGEREKEVMLLYRGRKGASGFPNEEFCL